MTVVLRDRNVESTSLPGKRRGEKFKFTVFHERFWSHQPYLI
jgi:hypothetical protein